MRTLGRLSIALLLCGCGGRADVAATELGGDTRTDGDEVLPGRGVIPDQGAVPSLEEPASSNPNPERPRNGYVPQSEPPSADQDDASSNPEDDRAVIPPVCELREIEALLQDKCAFCHKSQNFRVGSDCYCEEEPVRMSGLIERGIVIPGNAEMSLLVRRVVLGEMPPANQGYAPLPRADVRRLEAFIDSLAPDAGVSCPDSEATEE